MGGLVLKKVGRNLHTNLRNLYTSLFLIPNDLPIRTLLRLSY